jgi:hypothetical protein
MIVAATMVGMDGSWAADAPDRVTSTRPIGGPQQRGLAAQAKHTCNLNYALALWLLSLTTIEMDGHAFD